MLLLLVALIAGVIAGVSPCVLPILPVVIVGWVAPVSDPTHPYRARRRRSLSVMAGLVLSFGLLTAIGSVILSSLHLPANLLRDSGIALLILFGVSLISPKIEQLLERPFQRFARSAPSGTRSGFLIGLGLGAVFVPCAGPVLATISVLGATHRANLYSVLLSLFFAVGAAIPLFIIAMIGDRFVEKNRRLSSLTRKIRPLAGVFLIVIALILAFNVADPLQRWIPNYTSVLQQKVEGNSYTLHALRSLSHKKSNNGNLNTCEQMASFEQILGLQKCGTAPNFVGITNWVNTSGDKPLNLSALRGHVVLIDFYTYSCINCQRSLPHVEAWYQRYHRYGFDVIGVQAPEFAFEHVLSNITAGAKSLGIKYPIAVDNNLATWDAYLNQYWPAEYLIDANGVIRHVAYGEGGYSNDEQLIRKLLISANPAASLPAPTSVPDRTPTRGISPETYLGSERSQFLQGSSSVSNGFSTYSFPSSLTTGNYALNGGWTTSNQFVTSSSGAQLELGYQASDVYLVLGGKGTVRESINGKYVKTITVQGFPTLYTLLHSASRSTGALKLTFSASVQVYDFTFG